MQCHLQCKGCETYAEGGDINTECCDVILSGYLGKNLGGAGGEGGGRGDRDGEHM